MIGVVETGCKEMPGIVDGRKQRYIFESQSWNIHARRLKTRPPIVDCGKQLPKRIRQIGEFLSDIRELRVGKIHDNAQTATEDVLKIREPHVD